MTSGATDNDSIELAVLKNPQIDTEIVSVALLEVTSPGLKLILQTQVTNPEHGRFQFFSKGVYGFNMRVYPFIAALIVSTQ